VLLPCDTHRKPITSITVVLLPFVTYSLTLPRTYIVIPTCNKSLNKMIPVSTHNSVIPLSATTISSPGCLIWDTTYLFTVENIELSSLESMTTARWMVLRHLHVLPLGRTSGEITYLVFWLERCYSLQPKSKNQTARNKYSKTLFGLLLPVSKSIVFFFGMKISAGGYTRCLPRS
jgi:hypothetical protein